MTALAVRRRGLYLFLAFSMLSSLLAEPVAEIPSEGEPGGPISIKVDANGGPVVARADLRTEEGVVVSNNVFFSLPGSTNQRLVAVLGIPADLEPGKYEIVLIDHQKEPLLSRAIEVTSKAFRAETIELSGAMSELRQTDDPRRLTESRALWQLLNHRDPFGLHHYGPFCLPLAESVRSSHFGDQRLFVYTNGGTDGSMHSGIDLVASPGTPVVSSGNGLVVFAEERMITGNTVVIEHLPGMYSLYYHLAELSVVSGDTVASGQEIGLIGATGLVTGVHLHWEFRIGGIPVDPDSMISFEL